MGAGRDRDLVLAREVGVVRIAVEERRHLVVQRSDVEELVMGETGNGAAGEVPDGVAAGADRGQADVAKAVEDRGKRRELEVVELDRLAGGQLAGTAAVLVRELTDRAELLRRHPPGGQLDPKHERPDLRLVVVEAPPLEPNEILLLDVGVACRDQRRQLAHHGERALLPLQPLDRVALEHELERRRLLHRSSRFRHLVPPQPRKRHRAPIPEPWTVPTAPALHHLPGRRPGWAASGWSSHLTDGRPGCGGFVGPGPSTAHDG